MDAALRAVLNELESVKARQTYPRSLVARTPELRGRDMRLPVGILQRDAPGDAADNDLTITVARDGRTSHWTYRTALFDRARILELQGAFTVFLQHVAAHVDARLAQVPLLTEADRERMLVTWNATHKAYRDDATVHGLFEEQVRRTPDAIAVVSGDQQRSYDELNRAANQLARHLRRLGAGPEVLVGICLERSIDLLTGVYGILKAGAAYVPLDPTYPADRLALMVEDSGCPILVTQRGLLHRLPPHRAKVVCIDTDWESVEREPEDDLDVGVTGRNLSYVIYTSGSTGRPKGVMVEHRNVTNFFAGMDDRVPHDPPGTWLAVTSLSFDISVLELFWTMSRGFKVVLHDGPGEGRARGRHRLQPVLFRQRRRRERRRQVRAPARRGQVRGPARLRRGVDAGAALRRVRRAVSQSGRHQRRPGVDHAIDRPPRGELRLSLAPPHPDRRGVGGRGQHLRRPRRDLVCVRLAAERLRAAAGELRRSP